jgi:protein SPT2
MSVSQRLCRGQNRPLADSKQYLSSILASIGGNENPPAPSGAPQPRTNGQPAGAGTTDTPGGQKRKAEGDLNNGVTKTQRQDSSSTNANGSLSRPAVAPPPGPGAYRGTARADIAKPPSKPLPKVQAGISSTTPAIKPEKKSIPAPSTPVAPPPATGPLKKGSYAEIMARAKAAQGVKPNVGTIKHKPTEKLSRRERLALLDVTKKGKSKSVPIRDKRPEDRAKASERSRTGSSEPVSGKAGDQPKEKRKPLDLGYKGTMRPVSAEPQYKGTMNLARPNQPRKPFAKNNRHGGNSYGSRDQKEPRYASYSEDELEEEDDYASDASSDMEADAFEVDREEELALRAAKLEDAKAASEEAEHRRKKDERKKMLAKMAADKAKKKPVY